LAEVLQELEDPAVWANSERCQALGRERVQLLAIVSEIKALDSTLENAAALQELFFEEKDPSLQIELQQELQALEPSIAKLEFQCMFSGRFDNNSAFLDIQSGSGGTEAQDWANIILRMYLRWGERKGFGVDLIDISGGEVAGIKGATLKFEGPYAYGWLRTETGVHRLVRKSPFDSGNRRHTSFASVFVYPDIEEDIDIEINPADLRIDTYRASGAGGQHVNRTDSAVRLTHIPTNTVVQCQSDRSQHKNKAYAMKQLKAKLYNLEVEKRNSEKKVLEENKADIGWGSQIRSYVLDQSRVKDLRTNLEISNPDGVLNGDKELDALIEATLKLGDNRA